MADYVVETPNAAYKGKTLGVRFEGGVARVNDDTVPEKLGRTADEVAAAMAQEYGYTVRDAAGAVMFTVPEMPWKKEDSTPTPTPPPSATGEGGPKKK